MALLAAPRLFRDGTMIHAAISGHTRFRLRAPLNGPTWRPETMRPVTLALGAPIQIPAENGCSGAVMSSLASADRWGGPLPTQVSVTA